MNLGFGFPDRFKSKITELKKLHKKRLYKPDHPAGLWLCISRQAGLSEHESLFLHQECLGKVKAKHNTDSCPGARNVPCHQHAFNCLKVLSLNLGKHKPQKRDKGSGIIRVERLRIYAGLFGVQRCIQAAKCVCKCVFDTVCLHFRQVASALIWSIVHSVSRWEFSGFPMFWEIQGCCCCCTDPVCDLSVMRHSRSDHSATD